ncbi:unnamed protein product [Rotaria sp. Silwood1]|nr:unnamed protein product [Rotaria sp. Silwood1]CAF1622442.1 unnamed protein product [Rotaria sp. Silwood1]CAF3785511.1 unnamed protein product [Rotaria sp. Silwood1]CAF3885824.1 unnamed protein product [Rotaria sp. Silwood1]CAF4803614.1 unnamed protein product [Rotaria sp. Silwood1]
MSETASSAIDKAVADTAAQQQQLSEANENSDKAVLLTEFERALNEHLEAILLKARQDIELLQDAANQQKMTVFKEVQALAHQQQVDQITEEAIELAAEITQRRNFVT